MREAVVAGQPACQFELLLRLGSAPALGQELGEDHPHDGVFGAKPGGPIKVTLDRIACPDRLRRLYFFTVKHHRQQGPVVVRKRSQREIDVGGDRAARTAKKSFHLGREVKSLDCFQPLLVDLVVPRAAVASLERPARTTASLSLRHAAQADTSEHTGQHVPACESEAMDSVRYGGAVS